MKRTVVTIFLVLVLDSCQDESIIPSLTTPHQLRETYYDFGSGNKTGEKNYEYNQNGKLIHDSFVDLNNSFLNTETFYDYDADENLIKQKTSMTGNPTQFTVLAVKYKNGLKLSDSTYYEGWTDNWWTRRDYFYNGGNIADSARIYGPLFGTDDLYKGSMIYSYDDSGQLISETSTMHRGSSTYEYAAYSYEGNKLISTCYESVCFINEYDENDLLIKVTSHLSGVSRLTEELYYKDGVLNEKRKYNYDTYDLNASYTSITQIKYEY